MLLPFTVLTCAAAVSVPPGTEAVTGIWNMVPTSRLKSPLEASPALLVVTMEEDEPLSNTAPPLNWGMVNTTGTPATGWPFSPVTLATASVLTRPFFKFREGAAFSSTTSVNFADAPGSGGCAKALSLAMTITMMAANRGRKKCIFVLLNRDEHGRAPRWAVLEMAAHRQRCKLL